MMMTVQDIYQIIDRMAPFDTQEDFDNAGLLVGDPAMAVRGIHVALDVTERVLDEAEAVGANLIVTHHPIMFSPVKRLVTTDYETRLIFRMVRAGMALIAAHTNFDRAPGGMNDALAARCGLTEVTGEGFIRIGSLPHPMTGRELTAHIAASLDTVVRPMGDAEKVYRRMALCSGGGSDFWAEGLALGADAFLTGEMKHHHALALADAGMLGLEAGHFATELPGVFALANALQNAANAVQYDVCISTSQAGAYAPPARP